MQVITGNNVNDVYAAGLRFLCKEGQLQTSRAGDVLALPTPMTLVYEKPQQRVLFDASRDSNPFFSLFEALWMLAGRNDAQWLDRFISDFSTRFAEEGGRQHGAYGFRWREHFDMEGGGSPNLPDQLDTVVRLLRENPDDRRVVLTMWDPVADLGSKVRDVPCNLVITPRIRREVRKGAEYQSVLDITVFCRSNDFVWGATGANAVHFSVLQEYLAGRIGVGIGRYYQCSNNMHVYTKVLAKLEPPEQPGDYPPATPMGTFWDKWDEDLTAFMAWVDNPKLANAYHNNWFAETAEPLFFAHKLWKDKQYTDARFFLHRQTQMASDWRAAALAWFERRILRMYYKKATTA